jgi:propanol-preferring alcohol dehydrogenase
MPTMIAFRMTAWHQPPAFVEVPVPEPGYGEVLLKVAGVGLCHTDLHFFEADEGQFPYPLPFTLGHEVAGWVTGRGPGVDDIEVGTPVVALAHAWCGRCRNCVSGNDNYCLAHGTGLGFGADGGFAEYVVVQRHSLVDLGELDPRLAGPLADAGNTAYHAVKRVLPKLTPGSTTVVLGVGGLGSHAVQILRAVSSTRIIAVDVSPRRAERAHRLGADTAVVASADLDNELRELTSGEGASAILDFVGTDASIRTALALSTPLGAIGIVGGGGGTAHLSWSSIARECDVFIPQNGTLADLREVVALAQSGAISVDREVFSFEDVMKGYEALRLGELDERAVVVMEDVHGV